MYTGTGPEQRRTDPIRMSANEAHGKVDLMPQYAIFIHDVETPGGFDDLPPEILEAHMALGQKISDLGATVVNQQACLPSDTITTVHKGGLITDGPFIESKEALAGFFVIEVPDLDVALAIARLVPLMDGAVEVRPLLDPPSDGPGGEAPFESNER